jgi:hypothetical protein
VVGCRIADFVGLLASRLPQATPAWDAIRPLEPSVTTPRRGNVDPLGQPSGSEIEAERLGWYEQTRLVHSLDAEEVLEPGYYTDPDWSVADLVAHVGTWLAEAGVQLERIAAGTYEHQEVDVDARNAEFRAAMGDQPWSVIHSQAEASRSRMLKAWYGLPVRTPAAAWWVAKAGPVHYSEHIDRLREWVAILHARR